MSERAVCLINPKNNNGRFNFPTANNRIKWHKFDNQPPQIFNEMNSKRVLFACVKFIYVCVINR